MKNAEQFVGHWISWKGDNRFEQVLDKDGTFKGFVFDDDDTICHVVTGKWKLDGNTDWQEHFGDGMGAGGGSVGPSPSQTGVPEPATLLLLMFATAVWSLQRNRFA